MNIETNKIAGAVFGTLLFVVGINIVAGGLFSPEKPAVPGYDLPAPEETAAAGGGPLAGSALLRGESSNGSTRLRSGFIRCGRIWKHGYLQP